MDMDEQIKAVKRANLYLYLLADFFIENPEIHNDFRKHSHKNNKYLFYKLTKWDDTAT